MGVSWGPLTVTGIVKIGDRYSFVIDIRYNLFV